MPPGLSYGTRVQTPDIQNDSHIKADPTECLSPNFFPAFALVQDADRQRRTAQATAHAKERPASPPPAPLPCSAASPLFYALFCNLVELALRRFERQINHIPYAVTRHRIQASENETCGCAAVGELRWHAYECDDVLQERRRDGQLVRSQ